MTKFKVDVSILRLRSEAFNKMLESKFKEGTTGICKFPTYTPEDFSLSINILTRMDKMGSASDEDAIAVAPFFHQYLFVDALAWVDEKLHARIKKEVETLGRNDGARFVDLPLINMMCKLLKKGIQLTKTDGGILGWVSKLLSRKGVPFPMSPGMLSVNDVANLQPAIAEVAERNQHLSANQRIPILPGKNIMEERIIMSEAFPYLFQKAWELGKVYEDAQPVLRHIKVSNCLLPSSNTVYKLVEGGNAKKLAPIYVSNRKKDANQDVFHYAIALREHNHFWQMYQMPGDPPEDGGAPLVVVDQDGNELPSPEEQEADSFVVASLRVRYKFSVATPGMLLPPCNGYLRIKDDETPEPSNFKIEAFFPSVAAATAKAATPKRKAEEADTEGAEAETDSNKKPKKNTTRRKG